MLFCEDCFNVVASLTSLLSVLSPLCYQSVKFEQARKPRSYASPKLCPLTHSLTDLLTGVKCRATSVAKNNLTDVLSPFYESDMCYSAEVLFKTAKKKGKNHIYTTAV